MKTSEKFIRPKNFSRQASEAGFTLVELLVALALGLFLMGGVVSIFVSNQQSARTNNGIARLQENARFAVELLSREIRDAGSNPCGVRAVNNIIRRNTGAQVPWWGNWGGGTLRGFNDDISNPINNLTGYQGVPFGTGNNRTLGTDAIAVLRTSIDEQNVYLVQNHVTPTTAFTLNTITGIENKHAMMVCDGASGAIFQVGDAPTGNTITYNNATPSLTNNCSNQLGWQPNTNCNLQAVNKTFPAGSFVVRYDPAFWFIATSNGGTATNGARSLYRAGLTVITSAGNRTPTMTRTEMVPDVQDMRIQYLIRTNPPPAALGGPAPPPAVLATQWVDADNALLDVALGGWSTANLNEVVAVKVTLTLSSRDVLDASGNPLTRSATAIINLRNRDINPS
jgi:type IV pilus assembly protein PilW